MREPVQVRYREEQGTREAAVRRRGAGESERESYVRPRGASMNVEFQYTVAARV